MSVRYADTSALARAYLPDEPEHDVMRELLLESEQPIVTSEIALVEIAAAMTAAERARRIDDAEALLSRIEEEMTGDPVILINLDTAIVFPVARRLLVEHPIFALDALHLATALAHARMYVDDGGVILVTCDRRQADAARAEGLAVWE